MDGIDIFLRALGQATTVVKQVRSDHFANATPDNEWNVRDLVGHMLYELSWVPDVLAGKTIEEVGDAYNGDLIGASDVDLTIHWQTAADKAEAAINEADLDEVAHLSYGDISVDDYLQQAGTDQLIHAWDLGKAIGVTVRFDTDIAEAIYERTLPNKEAMQQSGLFAPVIAVADRADIQTRLLGLFGRDSNWTAVNE